MTENLLTPVAATAGCNTLEGLAPSDRADAPEMASAAAVEPVGCAPAEPAPGFRGGPRRAARLLDGRTAAGRLAAELAAELVPGPGPWRRRLSRAQRAAVESAVLAELASLAAQARLHAATGSPREARARTIAASCARRVVACHEVLARLRSPADPMAAVSRLLAVAEVKR